MSVNYVKIWRCNDPSKWYAKGIGDIYKIIPDPWQYKNREWRVRCSDGYLNFISFADCTLLDSDLNSITNDDGITRVIDLPPAPKPKPKEKNSMDGRLVMRNLANSMFEFSRRLDCILEENEDFMRSIDTEMWNDLVDLSVTLERIENTVRNQ